MRRAIELSRLGFPAPNPHVGCVIVRSGEVIAEGYHHFAGDLHAEADALKHLSSAQGSDVYVTLEPCNHHGRQPPCSLALINAGVKRVFIACPDENPKASGGAQRLRNAGIEVIEGLLREEAAVANQQFLFAVQHRRPLIVAKAAMSLDGRIALPNGESKWITGEAARAEGHRLRAELGAVLVGRRTVQLDNPRLTARLDGVHNQPTRIVLDPGSKLSGNENVFNEEAPTIHVTGHIDLSHLLSDLYAQGITGILVEGGATTLGTFAAQNLVDRYELFIAPKLLGHGPQWLNTTFVQRVADAPQLTVRSSRQLGDDLWITLS